MQMLNKFDALRWDREIEETIFDWAKEKLDFDSCKP